MSWIGFGNAVAGNVAALVAGQVIDRCFQRRLKLGIIVGLFGCFLCQLWFMLQLPCVLWPESSGGPPLPRSEMALVAALTLSGFFQGLTSPLFYELSAE